VKPASVRPAQTASAAAAKRTERLVDRVRDGIGAPPLVCSRRVAKVSQIAQVSLPGSPCRGLPPGLPPEPRG